MKMRTSGVGFYIPPPQYGGAGYVPGGYSPLTGGLYSPIPATVHSYTPTEMRIMLTSWATLATLLAGTQSSLLSYYPRGSLATTVSLVALTIDIYGAVMAAVTISLSVHLGTRSGCVVEKLAAGTGWIVKLGGALEFAALAVYINTETSFETKLACAIGMAGCLLTTLFGLVWGLAKAANSHGR